MSTTPKVLITQKDIPNVATLAFQATNTANTGVWVDQFDVCNYSAASVNVSVWIVPNPGTTTANSNIRLLDFPVGSKETKSLDAVVGSFLGPGDAIWWSASAATAVNGGASGRLIA